MSSRQALETVEIEPAAPADAAIVLMHGLGADGHDFEPLAGELGLGPAPAVRWVLPHAPFRSVTINRGFRMRAWYDIASLDGSAEDEGGIVESARAIRGLIARERERGIASDRIVVAGFSQGGALALHTALREPSRLAGVIALSTYLPLASKLEREAHPANAAVPVFMAHGSHDPVLPFVLGQRSCELLRARGYDVDWHTYPMAHSVCAEEIAALRDWLARVLPPRG
jgi:phospholipase/carboxylesterase